MSEIQAKLTSIYADRIGKWAENHEVSKESLVKNLAEELAKNAYEIYYPMEEEYVRQDVDYVADEILNLNLTKEERDAVIDRYMNSDAYGVIDNDDIIFFINEVKREEA